MRKMKKALAVALSASMVMGMSMTTFAADQEVSVDAPIYAFDVTNVIVPTNFVVAFNPNGLDVDIDGDGTKDTDSQIVSRNYGIINKSTQDKVITVTLNVEDLNEDKINFVADPTELDSASSDDYMISLKVVPADDNTKVKVNGASADKDTDGAALANVTMNEATGADQPLVAGENEVSFLLAKAQFTGMVDMTKTSGNNVMDDFDISGLDADGNGITAFTLGGTMNNKADWTKLTKGIRITAVYSNENAPDGAAAETGTGALYNNPNPVFKTGDGVGTIKYKAGTGDDAIASISKIEMEINGKIYDGFKANGTNWAKATDENGLITLKPEYLAFYTKAFPNDATREATITYMTAGEETRTAKVDVRLKAQVGASFTTGSAVGSIKYTVGTGNDALASITKIEMEINGKIYDGYHENGKNWADATDVNGLVTLKPEYLAFYTKAFPDDTTREATITYVTAGGVTKTTTVNVKLK